MSDHLPVILDLEIRPANPILAANWETFAIEEKEQGVRLNAILPTNWPPGSVWIERSLEEESFEVVGEKVAVPGQELSFEDAQVPPTWLRYRLRSFDQEGQEYQSPTRLIDLGPAHRLHFSLHYPRDSDKIEIQLSKTLNAPFQVEVRDLQGRVISHMNYPHDLSNRAVHLNTSSWPPGACLIELRCPEQGLYGRQLGWTR